MLMRMVSRDVVVMLEMSKSSKFELWVCSERKKENEKKNNEK